MADTIFGDVLIRAEELPNLREKLEDKKIVFCSGSFDLLHLGHVYFFKHAKDLGDLLVVSVGPDSVIKRNKGDKRPIVGQDLRLQMVAAVRFVDFCFVDDEPNDEHPLATLKTNLKLLKPDIYVVNFDVSNVEYRKSLLVGTSTKLIALNVGLLSDQHLLSTTSLIQRIKAL